MRPSNLLAILVIAASCAEEPITKTEPSGDWNLPTSAQGKVVKPPKNPTTVTGLTRFKASNLAIPSFGLPDAQRFYSDGSLRASTAYNPYGITAVTRDGRPRVRFYVNPTSPPEYLMTSLYPYHFRAEFSRHPWRISHPLGTEEWLGFSYIFPTVEQGFVQNQTPVSIYQNHAGSVAGQTENPPALQLEIAYPGQIKDPTNPYRQTPLGGEIMIINNVRGSRFVVQSFRITPGCRLNVVMQIVYGLGSEGLFNVWINGKLIEFPGYGTIPGGNIGSTVWPPKLETDVPVGGNSKLGLYHHQLRLESSVLLNSAAGHTQMEVFMTDWNDVFRRPGDWDYKNTNGYKAVNTSEYP